MGASCCAWPSSTPTRALTRSCCSCGPSSCCRRGHDVAGGGADRRGGAGPIASMRCFRTVPPDDIAHPRRSLPGAGRSARRGWGSLRIRSRSRGSFRWPTARHRSRARSHSSRFRAATPSIRSATSTTKTTSRRTRGGRPRGTFRVQQWLEDDRFARAGRDGRGLAGRGDRRGPVRARAESRSRIGPEGTVPVMVFGHGIFANPSLYLDQADDSLLGQPARRGGRVHRDQHHLARGLTTKDLSVALEVANDFANFHQLTDLLVQGQLNTRALIEYAQAGGLLDDPVFQGASGQSLADKDQIVYYGISLGAIRGGRSSSRTTRPSAPRRCTWGARGGRPCSSGRATGEQFELFITASVPAAADRQFLYAVSQLWWDPVDPMSYASALADRVLPAAVRGRRRAGAEPRHGGRSRGPRRCRCCSRPGPRPRASPPSPRRSRPDRGRWCASIRSSRCRRPRTAPPPVTDAHTTPRTWDGGAACRSSTT